MEPKSFQDASETQKAKNAKIALAPRREHDFQGRAYSKRRRLGAKLDKKTYPKRSQNQDRFYSRFQTENGAKIVAKGSQDRGKIGEKSIKNRSQI